MRAGAINRLLDNRADRLLTQWGVHHHEMMMVPHAPTPGVLPVALVPLEQPPPARSPEPPEEYCG